MSGYSRQHAYGRLTLTTALGDRNVDNEAFCVRSLPTHAVRVTINDHYFDSGLGQHHIRTFLDLFNESSVVEMSQTVGPETQTLQGTGAHK